MNYNYLKYFNVLAQVEHYTQAAELLSISQPSLSHAIDELEKELGVALFEKRGRNIKLTKYGKQFYYFVDSGLTEINNGIKAMESLASKDCGAIDLGFIYTLGSYYIPNLMKSFMKEYPNISFNLHQGTSHNVVQLLEEEVLDVGFCSMIENKPNISYIPIVKEEIVLIVSNHHPLATFDEIDLCQIDKDEKWILYSKKSGLRSYIDQIFELLKIQPAVQCEIEEDNAAIGLVDINFGIALVPNLQVIDQHNIKKIKIKNKIPERNIYIATLKYRFLTPSIHLLLNYVLYNSFDIKKIKNEN